MAYQNPYSTNVQGERFGSYSGSAVRMPTNGLGAPSTGSSPTFSALQKQGVARPPAPKPAPPYGYPAPAPAPAPYPMPSGQPGYPKPVLPPTSLQQRPIYQPPTPATAVPGGTQITTPAANAGQPDLMQTLLNNYLHPQNSPVGNGLQSSIMALLGKPSAYDSQVAQQTFDRMKGDVDAAYNVDQQKIREEMASRGLGDSTIYGGRLGDLSIQHGHDLTNLASQIAEDQAKSSGQDRINAITTALGFQGQQQNSAQQALQNLLGYGQQSFENQVTTEQLNNTEQQQQINYLLQLFGLA